MGKKAGLKRKIRSGALTIGSWITIGHPSVAEIMAGAGFDWLAVDMEHSAITLDIAQGLIQVIELSGVSPLVRVGENDPALIKRVMDAGAHGVIVPMVNTRDDAERAVAAVRYPPRGMRGVGLARAQSYGLDFEGYRKWNEKESVVVVQVEHIEAVRNLEAILSVDGVDAFIIGPYDLSGSLGVPGRFDHPDVIKALDRVRRVAREMGAVPGFHVIPPSPKAFLEKAREGYRFLAFSVDMLFLGTVTGEGLGSIRKALK